MAPPIQMSDALAANWTGEFERIVAKCLAHARRQFVDIEPAFPRECATVLDAIGAVYGFDAQTRAMNDEQRLLFHQQQSGPVVAALRAWLDKQIGERMVEPNSSLGGAFAYLLKHWDGLTKFLEVAGAPLDNNVCERMLKLAVLNRKNALFYKTQRGASTGDCLMSLIKICALNNINVWEYLLALVRNERLVGREPAQWLPWNYRAASERREQAA